MNILKIIIISLILLFVGYSIIGTSYKVDEIKMESPKAISERGWKILRYEGYQFGSFNNNGGKVWYHVVDTGNPNIQYRIYITKWGDELQFNYGEPESISRIQVNQ